MPLSMFDSVTISEIPSNAAAVAGYVGGRFPTFSALVAAFPHALHLSIAINAAEDAECLDVETGDAFPSEAPAWVKRQHARGITHPVVYSSASEMPSVLGALSQAGIPRAQYRVWTAHFTGFEHIEPGSDATQWTDRALGRNLDESLCVDGFFDAVPAPPAQNEIRYAWFVKVRVFGKRIDEQKIVRAYDRLRMQMTPDRKPAAARVKLAALRKTCLLLAKRIDRVAHQPGKGGYRVDHRGYRRLQLWGRAQGQRFV